MPPWVAVSTRISSKLSVCDVLLGEASASQALQHSSDAGYDILPANADLTAAEVQLVNKIGRERQLALALEGLRDNYDYILIDCPPSLNMLTVNALVAADGVSCRCNANTMRSRVCLRCSIPSSRFASA